MPSLVFCTGFGHGLNVSASWIKGNAGSRFADFVTGTPQIVSDGAGGYELEVSAAGATEGVAWDSNTIGTATGVLVAGFPVQVNSNTGNAAIAALITSNATRDLALWFRDSDDRLVMTESTSISSTTVGTPRPSTDPITLGQRYWIDVRIVVTGTTWAVDWAIDGVAQTAYTTTGMGSTDTITRMELGYRSTAYTYVARYKCLLVSRTSADYPLGQHKVPLLKPDTGGTAAQIGTANATAAMTSNSSVGSVFNGPVILTNLSEVPPLIGASASGVAQRTAGSTNAVGIPMTSYALQSGESISGLDILVCGWSATAVANNLELRVFNGTTETSLFALADPNFDADTATPGWICKMAPAASFDTQAELDALVVRLGYATDVSPNPGAHAIYAEVAIKESVGGPTVVNVGQLVETEGLLGVNEVKLVRPGQVVETNAPLPVTMRRLVKPGQLIETEAIFAVTEQKLVKPGQLVETESALAVAARRLLRPGQLVETEGLLPAALLKQIRPGQLSEIETVWPATIEVIPPAGAGTYTNHVAIAAPRNGTATHTVHPDGTGGTVVDGSAFSPTSGRLLVCVVEGAVTTTGPGGGSSTPAGWTLPTNGSAVNFSGLYVFHRTASATSADQVAATHNGSDYPVIFDFYEFPAGSTFGVAASAVNVSDGAAGPGLSGLTGTNWTAGAVGQANSNTSTVVTTAWGSGTEELDQSVVKVGTDGYVYSLTFTIGDTASSRSYAATTTPSGSNKERLAFSLAVPSAGATVVNLGLLLEIEAIFSAAVREDVKPGQLVEAESPLSTTMRRIVRPTLLGESEGPMAAVARKTVWPGLLGEVEQALSATSRKQARPGQVAEGEGLLTLAARKDVRPGQLVETEQSLAITARKLARPSQLTETEQALAVLLRRMIRPGLLIESELPLAVTARKMARPSFIVELESISPVTVGGLTYINLALLVEVEGPLGVTVRTIARPSLLVETEAALHPTLTRQVALGLVAESELAQHPTTRKLVRPAQLVEVELVLNVSTGTTVVINLGKVFEVEQLFGLTTRKLAALGMAAEVELVQPATVREFARLGLLGELEGLYAARPTRLLRPGLITETELVRAPQLQTIAKLGQVLELEELLAAIGQGAEARVLTGQLGHPRLVGVFLDGRLVGVFTEGSLAGDFTDSPLAGQFGERRLDGRL